jgi:hypothetical protein
MAVRLSALRTRHTLLPRNIIIFMFMVLIYVRGWVNPRAYLEILMGWDLVLWTVKWLEPRSAPIVCLIVKRRTQSAGTTSPYTFILPYFFFVGNTSSNSLQVGFLNNQFVYFSWFCFEFNKHIYIYIYIYCRTRDYWRTQPARTVSTMPLRHRGVEV